MTVNPRVQAQHEPPNPVGHLNAKRLLIAAGTAFLAINIWTGAPLFALWVGSQAVGQERLSMTAVFVVVIVLAVLVFAMAVGLVWLDARYKQMTGHPLRENRSTWLRGMNTQGESVSLGVPMSVVERIVMVSVYLAVIALIVFFLLFASASPLPN